MWLLPPKSNANAKVLPRWLLFVGLGIVGWGTQLATTASEWMVPSLHRHCAPVVAVSGFIPPVGSDRWAVLGMGVLTAVA